MNEQDLSDMFNALPFEARRIGAAMESKLRIQHLLFERNRCISRHKKSLEEIDQHIKNCRHTLERYLRELAEKC